MASRIEVEQFLTEFFVKYRIFDILFTERIHQKNAQTAAMLDLTTVQKKKIIESLDVRNYVGGPIDDILYKGSGMWIFGYTYKTSEIYIKISMGGTGASVICISFHISQFPMAYPFN